MVETARGVVDDDAKIQTVPAMTFYLIMFGGMLLFGGVMTLIAWLGVRQDKRRKS